MTPTTQHDPRLGLARRIGLNLCCALAAAVPLACDRAGERNVGESDGVDEHAVEAASDEHVDEAHLTPEAIARYGIEVAPAQKRALVPMFRVPAQVAFNSEAMAHVGIPVKGRVIALRVRLGDEVRKGDALLVVESPELGEAQSDFLQKRSAAANALPAVDLARNAHERAQALHEKNQGIALTEVQRREAEYRSTVAALAGAKAAEEAARSRLRLLGMQEEALGALASSGAIDPHFTVEAPISGQVVEREATLGELVGPEREALIVLADMKSLWVIADVPEARLRDVTLGARARVLLGSEGEHWCEGTLSFISPSLDTATRTAQVRILLSDRHPELRPGVFANAEIETATDRAAVDPVLTVPESATQVIDAVAVVFVPVPGEDGAFRKRAVIVDRPVAGFVPVLTGLAEGESVVVAGSFLLKAELGKSSAEHDH